MLKAISTITNAIGALNYKGTWNASTNTPTLADGTGAKGDYYVVSTAGTQTFGGIQLFFGLGDWIAYNGAVWQRVEGGANLNGVDLSVSGTSTLSGLTASTALALNASKEVVSVTNTGTGNNVLASSPSIATPTLTGNVQMSTGNLVVGTSGKGIDFSATSHPAGMTSELLADYEEGTWTPTVTGGITSPTYSENQGNYTKIGNTVRCQIRITLSGGTGSGAQLNISGLPYATNATFNGGGFNGYMDVNAVATYWYVPQGGNTNAIGYLPGGANAIAAGAMAGLSINATIIYST